MTFVNALLNNPAIWQMMGTPQPAQAQQANLPQHQGFNPWVPQPKDNPWAGSPFDPSTTGKPYYDPFKGAYSSSPTQPTEVEEEEEEIVEKAVKEAKEESNDREEQARIAHEKVVAAARGKWGYNGSQSKIPGLLGLVANFLGSAGDKRPGYYDAPYGMDGRDAISQRHNAYAQVLGVQPTGNIGHNPGDFDPVSGGVFDQHGVARNEDGSYAKGVGGTRSYATFADWQADMALGRETGWSGGVISDSVYNSLSAKGKANYDRYKAVRDKRDANLRAEEQAKKDAEAAAAKAAADAAAAAQAQQNNNNDNDNDPTDYGQSHDFGYSSTDAELEDLVGDDDGWNRGGLIAMNTGGPAMYYNTGGSLGSAAGQVQGLANRASQAAQAAQQAVNEVAQITGGGGRGGGLIAMPAPMPTGPIGDSIPRPIGELGPTLGKLDSLIGGGFNPITYPKGPVAQQPAQWGEPQLRNMGGPMYYQVGGVADDGSNLDTAPPMVGGAPIDAQMPPGGPMDPMAAGAMPPGGAMPPEGAMPPLPPQEPPRMTFADKVTAARETIKAGRTAVPTEPINTMPEDAPMMPAGMMDGQGDGPVDIHPDAGMLAFDEVGPDQGVDTVDAMLEEGSYVLNPEASEMFGEDVRAMMYGGKV